MTCKQQGQCERTQPFLGHGALPTTFRSHKTYQNYCMQRTGDSKQRSRRCAIHGIRRLQSPEARAGFKDGSRDAAREKASSDKTRPEFCSGTYI